MAVLFSFPGQSHWKLILLMFSNVPFYPQNIHCLHRFLQGAFQTLLGIVEAVHLDTSDQLLSSTHVWPSGVNQCFNFQHQCIISVLETFALHNLHYLQNRTILCPRQQYSHRVRPSKFSRIFNSILIDFQGSFWACFDLLSQYMKFL